MPASALNARRTTAFVGSVFFGAIFCQFQHTSSHLIHRPSQPLGIDNDVAARHIGIGAVVQQALERIMGNIQALRYCDEGSAQIVERELHARRFLNPGEKFLGLNEVAFLAAAGKHPF